MGSSFPAPTDTDLLLPGPAVLVEDVHVDGEGDVLQHEEDVCHRDGEEDQVDGVGAHLPVAQHEDVQQVEEDAEHADHDGEVAVQPLPRLLAIGICNGSSKVSCHSLHHM